MEQKVKSLSWSKINMFLTNKKSFIETYFEWKEFFETKEILFWKTLWKMLELQEFKNEDLIVQECMRNLLWEVEIDKRKEELIRTSFRNIQKYSKQLSVFSSFECYSEFERKLQNFVNWVCVLGFADNTSENLKTIYEFKTWKTPWDDKKVNEFWQLDLYCLLTYLEKWYFPETVQLWWFETRNNENDEIELVDKPINIHKFVYDVEKNKDRILSWQEKIPQIFEEIQKAQIEWENSKEAKNDIVFENTDIFENYIELEKQKKEIEAKQEILKREIEEKLKSKKLENFDLEWWKFYFVNRKKYNYDENILNLEKTQKEVLKKVKEEFEKSNEPEISQSLCFRAVK